MLLFCYHNSSDCLQLWTWLIAHSLWLTHHSFINLLSRRTHNFTFTIINFGDRLRWSPNGMFNFHSLLFLGAPSDRRPRDSSQLLFGQVNIRFSVSTHHLGWSMERRWSLLVCAVMITCTCYRVKARYDTISKYEYTTRLLCIYWEMAKPSDRQIVRCVKVESCSINRALLCICVAATKPLEMQFLCCGLHY